MPTVSAHVATTLARYVHHVFGIMGNGNAYFLDAIERGEGAEFTPLRHEAGAVVAADAYYRAGGGLAAATTTYGAGFTNTLTALAEAVQARSPLILVVGDEPTAGPRPWDVDQIALAAAVGARTYTVGRADAAATTVIAVEHALTYRVPTVLAIPYDVARLDVGPVDDAPEPRVPAPLEVSDPFGLAALDEVAALLAGAARPLLLAGRGAWIAGARAELGVLADTTGALTATTALARGIFPRAEFDLGVAGGFGAEGAMAAVRDCDVAVVFGASLNQFTMRFGELFAPGTRVVQVDTCSAATHPHVSRFIRGDAAVVAAALVDRIAALRRAGMTPRSGQAGPEGETETAPQGRTEPAPPQPKPLEGRGGDVMHDNCAPWRESLDIPALKAYEPGDGQAADGLLDPRSAARRLGELLPDNRVVVSDGGHFIAWANMYWPVARPDRMMMVGTAYQSIGQGFPSVAGAARAQPDATVVLTTGDGGGLMALADLESAVRVAAGHGMAVVWNDRAYGAEEHLYGRKGLARAPMQIDEVDFAALAAAVGAQGHAIRTLADLDVVAEWASRPADERPFLLLDLKISGDVMAPYQREVIRVNS